MFINVHVTTLKYQYHEPRDVRVWRYPKLYPGFNSVTFSLHVFCTLSFPAFDGPLVSHVHTSHVHSF